MQQSDSEAYPQKQDGNGRDEYTKSLSRLKLSIEDQLDYTGQSPNSDQGNLFKTYHSLLH